MPFADFHGNADVVRNVREMLARDHFPHAVILSGAQGSGKFTLTQMVAKAMNCLQTPAADGLPDFCGVCTNCTRIAQADALEDRFAEAVEARENLRDADKRETRILVQTHPDVTIIPPDPPQMLVKVDQVRHVIREIYYRPAEGNRRVYIFSDADFMKEAANSLLKILEEPPDFATIFLLSDNPSALLPTIRSRCMQLRLAAVPLTEVEAYLAATRPDLKPRERSLVARLCGGGLGQGGFGLGGVAGGQGDAHDFQLPLRTHGVFADAGGNHDSISGGEGSRLHAMRFDNSRAAHRNQDVRRLGRDLGAHRFAQRHLLYLKEWRAHQRVRPVDS